MNTPRYTSILAFLAAGGKLVLVRHGETGPAETDLARLLTEKREGQATSTREYVDRNHNVALVLASPAQRVLTTVYHSAWPAPEPIEQLYPSPRYGIDSHFAALKYSTLVKYYEREGAQTLLETWAEEALTALDASIGEHKLAQGSTIVVGGHAVGLNQMGVNLINALGTTDNKGALEVAMTQVLEECSYLELMVRDNVPRTTYFPLQTAV